ncbi:uncharacterized protein LOC106152733 [Lingula anatina]|uniref:Uncharacterized protein LOC106152733 n=1 Tax=Lingula anatina TaxID=7574 RepID=A0A1S3H8U2_LINAN|nr:uncharacterized protein LOC106152733 [Lingula anatina]|eukprot:XP_013381896.1 uncharacterized protein LOC106152733 [Lingula anatina]
MLSMFCQKIKKNNLSMNFISGHIIVFLIWLLAMLIDGVSSSACPSGWFHNVTVGRCYMVSSGQEVFMGAFGKCYKMDAKQTMPKTEDLQAAVEALVTPPPPSHGQNPTYWIGLHQIWNDGPESLRWEDLEYLSPGMYSNICPNCVHADYDGCAGFYLDNSVSFQWIRGSCLDYHYYICEKIPAPPRCEFPSTPPNTLEPVGGNLEGDIITYTCQTGYTLISGDLTRTCLTGGIWSGSPPVCDFGGSWLAWGAWSSCSVICGTGTYSRNRTCLDPNLPSELALCAGGATNSTQTLSCFEQHCPGNCIPPRHCPALNNTVQVIIFHPNIALLWTILSMQLLYSTQTLSCFEQHCPESKGTNSSSKATPLPSVSAPAVVKEDPAVEGVKVKDKVKDSVSSGDSLASCRTHSDPSLNTKEESSIPSDNMSLPDIDLPPLNIRTTRDRADTETDMDLRKTSLVTYAVEPKWNENFTFEVQDHHKYFNICVWCKTSAKVDKQFRVIKPEMDFVIGHVSIPLMEIADQCLATTQGDRQLTYTLLPSMTRGGAR